MKRIFILDMLSEKIIRRYPKALSLLREIFIIDLITGLIVTLQYLLKPKVTVQYPEEKLDLYPRFRGRIRLFKDALGKDLCIACSNCANACPDLLITVKGERGEDKKLHLADFTYDISRCKFCGLCVESCPTNALRFTREYELAVLDKHRLFITKEEMYADSGVSNNTPAVP